jgi:hypothetical protein
MTIKRFENYFALELDECGKSIDDLEPGGIIGLPLALLPTYTCEVLSPKEENL